MMKRWLILLVMAFCMGSGTGRADDVLAVPDAWSFRIPDGYVYASFCGLQDGDVELALFPAQEDALVLFWKVFSGRKDFVSQDDYAKESTSRHCGRRGPTPEIVRNLSWLQDVAFNVDSGDYFQVFGDDMVSLFSISCGRKFCGTSQGIGYGSGGIVDEGLFARMSKKVVFLSRLDPYVKANAVFCVGHRRGEDAIYGFRQYVRTWAPKLLSLGDGTFLVVLTGLTASS